MFYVFSAVFVVFGMFGEMLFALQVIRARLGRNKNSCPYEKAFENAWYFKKSNGNGWNAARGGWSGAKITVTCKNSWG